MAKRKQYDARFKATVAIEAIKEQKTITQIASEYGVHPNQVGKWKKQLLSQLPQLFSDGRKKENIDEQKKYRLLDSVSCLDYQERATTTNRVENRRKICT